MKCLENLFGGVFLSNKAFDKVVAFLLDHEEYGIAMEKVISVERMSAIRKVPQTSSYIRGILEMRGEVIPIMDLRSYLLGSQNLTDSDSNRIIIVKVNEMTVGMVVDETTDILQVSEQDIEEVPIMGMKMNTGTMKVVNLKNRLVILMDIDNILNNSDIAEALKQVKDAV